MQLDKKVKLLDCPGIVFAKDDTDVAVILRNCVKIDAVIDPLPAFQVGFRVWGFEFRVLGLLEFHQPAACLPGLLKKLYLASKEPYISFERPLY